MTTLGKSGTGMVHKSVEVEGSLLPGCSNTTPWSPVTRAPLRRLAEVPSGARLCKKCFPTEQEIS